LSLYEAAAGYSKCMLAQRQNNKAMKDARPLWKPSQRCIALYFFSAFSPIASSA
jgi:hypothetical protein